MASLVLHFTSTLLDDEMASASTVLQKLNDPVIKMYFAFLAYVLPAMDKLNLDVQAKFLRLQASFIYQ